MKRESGVITLDMGQETKAGRRGRGSNSGRDGKGCGGRNSTMSRSVPSTVSEVGACEDLEGKMFTIGSGNKGMDEEMLRTSVEKMAWYIGTEFGAEAAQEWTSGKQTVLKEPAYSQVILARHAERVKATQDRLNRKLTSLRDERLEIEGELAADPGNRNLRKEMREVEDDIAKTKIELKDEIDLKLTDSEMAAHDSAWLTYHESSESLMKSRGIVFSLLLGQCTQVLVNEMEQDMDWAMISGSSDPNLLFELIRRIVLKQSDNQYKPSVVDVAEQECLVQAYTNNRNAEMQSTDAESVTLQGVQRDYGDALPSSEVRCTYLEACEEDAQTKYKGDTKVCPSVAVQAKAYVTGGKHDKGERGTQGFLPDEERDALSAGASPKPIESQKKRSSDKCDESVLSAMKANTNERNKGSSHSQDALGRHKGNLKSVLALKHGTYDKVDTACVVTRNEEALPKILSDIEMSDRQQISRAVQVREEQGYSPTAECGLMLSPEEISGCTDTPENVAERELVMQDPPSEIVEDCLFHADDLKFTTWRGQEMN